MRQRGSATLMVLGVLLVLSVTFAASALPVIRYTGTADSKRIPANARRFITVPLLLRWVLENSRIGLAHDNAYSIQSCAAGG